MPGALSVMQENPGKFVGFTTFLDKFDFAAILVLEWLGGLCLLRWNHERPYDDFLRMRGKDQVRHSSEYGQDKSSPGHASAGV